MRPPHGTTQPDTGDGAALEIATGCSCPCDRRIILIGFTIPGPLVLVWCECNGPIDRWIERIHFGSSNSGTGSKSARDTDWSAGTLPEFFVNIFFSRFFLENPLEKERYLQKKSRKYLLKKERFSEEKLA